MSEAKNISEQIQLWLTPNAGWKLQPDTYYAANFMLGAGLLSGDGQKDEANVRALAAEFQRMYEAGTSHGNPTGDYVAG